MMNTWRGIIFGAAIILAALGGFALGTLWAKRPGGQETKVKVDTLVVRDTITIARPIQVTKRVTDSVLIPFRDTIKLRDTIYVCLAREQLRWEDSLSVVYASGIMPQIDSVTHHVQSYVVKETIPVIKIKKTRWGIGLQAGYGIGKDGLTPWVGVGLSYNIISW